MGKFERTDIFRNYQPEMNPLPNSGHGLLGCSTGEEAYSLAIVFKEAIRKAKVKGEYFPTDICY